METVKDSFGIHGGQLFAILNVLQLAGWTAIMIYDGALAAQGIFQAGQWIWCLLIGVLIIVFSLLALILLAPLALLISLAIVLDSPGDGAIFRQRRVGRDGKLFWLYKFRTMCPDAEEQKASKSLLLNLLSPSFVASQT